MLELRLSQTIELSAIAHVIQQFTDGRDGLLQLPASGAALLTMDRRLPDHHALWRQTRSRRCQKNLGTTVNRQNTVGSEHFLKLSFAKFAPRLRARAIWKSKSLKHRGFGPLFEVELRKICTTLWRESDLEVKIVKN